MTKHLLSNINKPLVDKQNNKNESLKTREGEVWNFTDSYRSLICKQWLKAHNGFPLNKEDIQRYRRILIILKDVKKLMQEIQTILANGVTSTP